MNILQTIGGHVIKGKSLSPARPSWYEISTTKRPHTYKDEWDGDPSC